MPAGCKFTIKDMQIPLTGKNSIVGRAFVIHELEDDLGKGDNSEIGTQGKTSSTTGNAGARLACGVVGLTPSKRKIRLLWASATTKAEHSSTQNVSVF